MGYESELPTPHFFSSLQKIRALVARISRHARPRACWAQPAWQKHHSTPLSPSYTPLDQCPSQPAYNYVPRSNSQGTPYTPPPYAKTSSLPWPGRPTQCSKPPEISGTVGSDWLPLSGRASEGTPSCRSTGVSRHLRMPLEVLLRETCVVGNVGSCHGQAPTGDWGGKPARDPSPPHITLNSAGHAPSPSSLQSPSCTIPATRICGTVQYAAFFAASMLTTCNALQTKVA